MPVIVVGADTSLGSRIVEAMAGPEREVRAFVSDPDAVDRLRDLGVKVALGDVSDASHVGGACTNCFSAVLVSDAASDDRSRAFAGEPEAVLAAWAEAIDSAAVSRAIWVLDGEAPPTRRVPESATVPRSQEPDVIVDAVVALDDAREL
jgi:uncharacterized protein YbjT (DUF2867 family)